MTEQVQETRDTNLAAKRGALGRCPACGEGKLFASYLKVNHTCPRCDEELHHQQADDAPAYIVISIVGHIVVALLLWVELHYRPEMWVHMVLWTPLLIAMSLAMLPPVKGALIGMQWAMRLHGFGATRE